MGKIFTTICLTIIVVGYQKMEINIFKVVIQLSIMNLTIFSMTAISTAIIVFIIKERYKRL